jgi:hypothetical protein
VTKTTTVPTPNATPTDQATEASAQDLLLACLLERSHERYGRTSGIISLDERLVVWGRFAARPSAQTCLRKPKPVEL